jgi:glycosyltransferase
MKVSIITATYNSSESIKRTLDSIASQDYKNIEHIIIDGGSTDDTLEIVKKHHNQISKIISEKDNGIYDALNKGLKIATGDVIGFLNSDDYFSSDQSVSSIVTAFNASNPDIVYGDLMYHSVVNNKIKTIRYWKSNPFEAKSLFFGWMPPHPTIYCKREVYETYGDFNSNLKISADYDFILRVFKLSNLTKKHVPKVIVNMQMGGASNGSIKNLFVKTKEDYIVVKANKCGGFVCVFFKNIRKIKQFFNKHRP